MLQRLSFVLFVMLLLVGAVSAETPQTDAASTVTYSPTTDRFANPERGFYRYVSSRASQPLADRRWTQSDFAVPITWVSDVTVTDTTLLYCIFYLDSYVDDDTIPQSFLDDIAYNLNQVLISGRKCIVRFAYTSDDSDNNSNGTPDIIEPGNSANTEPPKARLLGHIDQLGPTLEANSHAIATVQAGFIGIWGEWYYSDHFTADPTIPWAISEADYANRLEVLTALLNVLPPHLQVAVRYPNAKMQMFDTTTPLNASTAHDGSLFSRVSSHNDAFLNSWGDSGTYRYNSSAPPGAAYTIDRDFLSAETEFTVNGGETNTPDTSGPGYPGRDCTITQNELRRFHWTYLNTDFYTPALTTWESGNCLDEIRDNLGYRLQLIEGTYGDAVAPGDGLSVTIQLRNTGYAAPINPRPVKVVLDGVGGTFSAELTTDIRTWSPEQGTIVLNANLQVPTCVSEGQYDLLLHLPDAADTLAARPEYAIRLANSGVWQAGSGYNDLLANVTVSSSAATTSGATDGAFSSENCVPTSVGLISAETTHSSIPLLLIFSTLLISSTTLIKKHLI